MSRAETEEFLGARSWGVLSTLGPDGPYGVPVAFGFDGLSAFVATGEGRKADHLRVNDTVCLTVVDVATAARWASVVLRGRARPLRGVAAVRGMAAIALQRARTLGASPADLRRASGATVYRIDPVELTGRSAG